MEKKAEKKRVSRIRRTKILAEEMEQLAATTTLTNDAMFEIAENQLGVTEKIAKMALVKFWDSLVITALEYSGRERQQNNPCLSSAK